MVMCLLGLLAMCLKALYILRRAHHLLFLGRQVAVWPGRQLKLAMQCVTSINTSPPAASNRIWRASRCA
jgi:hypothetical protein